MFIGGVEAVEWGRNRGETVPSLKIGKVKSYKKPTN